MEAVKTKEECGACIYMMQGHSCCVCGHEDAKPEGNGYYIYWCWDCDIDKFTPFDKNTDKIDQHELAKLNGWKLGKDRKNVIWPYWERK